MCHGVSHQASQRGTLAKDKFLVVRLEKKDLERIRRAASADHLETATWARQALLKSLERAEKGKD